MTHWHEWNGGSRQHGHADIVQVRFRDGTESTVRPADQFFWRWTATQRFDDIVAYRVVST